MRFLKRLMVVTGFLALGFFGGGCLCFAMGYLITGSDHSNPHGGLILS